MKESFKASEANPRQLGLLPKGGSNLLIRLGACQACARTVTVVGRVKMTVCDAKQKKKKRMKMKVPR